MELWETLSQVREKNGLSQMDVAEKLNVSRQAISNWETGKSELTVSHLIQLSQLYGVSMDELLSGEFKEEAEEPDGEEIVEKMSAAVDSPGKLPRIVVVALGGYLLIFLWGVLTNSKSVATGNMIFLSLILIVAALLYGIYRIIKYLSAKG